MTLVMQHKNWECACRGSVNIVKMTGYERYVLIAVPIVVVEIFK